MYNQKKTYCAPKNFVHLNAKYFLQNITSIFTMEGKRIPNVFFKVEKDTKADILGLLLIYKFLDFTVQKNCFENPETDLKNSKTISDQMRQIGFKKLVDENFNIKSIHEGVEQNPSFSEQNTFFIAPLVLDKSQKSVGTNNEKKINDYYSYNPKIASGILQCIGEIASNFQEHAVSDTKSVLVAKGNRQYIEIACADNGNGIISTLQPFLKMVRKNCRYEVLLEAIKENVTSKAEEGHMGCGLWIVNQFVLKTRGIMRIFSQNGYLFNINGNIKCGESPYWKGTIIYVNIPLSNPNAFSEVMKEKDDDISEAIKNSGSKIELNII